MSKTGTSFYQFLYCGLCNLSHKQRKKKHIYSQRHQSILKNVLTKFKKKIEDVRRSVVAPGVHPLGWESGARVWCYFCRCEVNRHQVRDYCTVANAVLIHHLAQKDHTKNMHEFFWDNLIDASKKVNFIVSSEEENRFFENAEKAVEKYLKDEKEKTLQEARRIELAEQQRQAVFWTAMQHQLGRSATVTTADPGSNSVNTQVETRTTEDSKTAGPFGKKTVSAFGPGLSCVSQPQDEELRYGNIYTGATPPWLLEDGAESGGEIGPTADTYKQHLQLLQKQKLPACRVGAVFNHKVDTSAQWLPTFGRVWNNGRRLNSKHQFLKGKARGFVKKNIAVHTALPPSSRDGGQHTEHYLSTPSTSAPFSSLAAGDGADTHCAEPEGHWLHGTNSPQGSARLGQQSVHSGSALYSDNTNSSSVLGSSTLQPSCSAVSWKSLTTSAALIKSHNYDNSSATTGATQLSSSFSWQPHATSSVSHMPFSSKRDQESEDMSVVCRPYKRRRNVSVVSSPTLSASLIPITPKLLSAPVRNSSFTSIKE